MQRDWTAEDKAQRERLERNSSAGRRADVVGMVNHLAKVHDGRALPGLSAYGVIRLLQSNGGAQAREARRHNKAHDAYLARAAARRIGDAGGSIDADAQTRRDKWDGQDVITLEAMRARTMAAVLSRYF